MFSNADKFHIGGEFESYRQWPRCDTVLTPVALPLTNKQS